MNDQRNVSTVLRYVLVLLVGLSTQDAAQSASPQKGELHGDWEVNFNGSQRTSILSFSKDPDGNQAGQWISIWGLSELKDVKYEAGKFSFTGKGPNRDGQSTTWRFTGTIKEDKLSGTVSSSDRGKHKVEGKRIPPMPDVVGNWAVGYTGNRVSSAIAIKVNKEGKLTAEWQYGKTDPITDLTYEEGKLTFRYGDGQDEVTYEGSLRKADTLDGWFKNSTGKTSVLAFRIGTPIIGTWNLEITSGRGPRKQRLKVNPDMSGWYGAIPFKKVNLEGADDSRLVTGRGRQPVDNTVTFKAVKKSGDRTVEMSFAGKVTESKLSGEITTSRGSAKVLGKKVVQTSRTRTTP